MIDQFVRLASSDGGPENVRVFPIIITELELGNIERQILLADFVERADPAAFEDGPEAFDGLCVNRTDDILPMNMINRGMGILFVEMLVANPLIGTKQAYFRRDGFMNEFGQCSSANNYLQHGQ
jgi:hypothetical protein